MQVKAKRKRIERPWPDDPAPDVLVRFNPDAPPALTPQQWAALPTEVRELTCRWPDLWRRMRAGRGGQNYVMANC